MAGTRVCSRRVTLWGVTELPIEMPPAELKALLDAGKGVRLIDVREPEEYAVCRIEGAQLIPMRTVPENLGTLRNEAALMVVYCVTTVATVVAVCATCWLMPMPSSSSTPPK